MPELLKRHSHCAASRGFLATARLSFLSFNHLYACAQCIGHSTEIGTSSLAFIKSHTLMEYTVDSLDGVPIYYTKHDLAATRLAVMHAGKYTVLFIGSSK